MLYIQTCITGIAIMLVPLVGSWRGRSRDRILFRTVLIATMAALIFETAGWMLDGTFFAHAVSCIYVMNFMTILLQPVMGLMWLFYSMEKLDIRFSLWSPKGLLCAVPFLLNTLLLLTNVWTGFVFSIGEDHLYVRGTMFWIDAAISFAYPVAVTVIAMHAASKATSRAQKRNCHVLAFFLVPPIVGAVLQLLFYGTFLFLIGFSISLLIVFVNLQNEQITIDALTRINNRGSFISYFERKVHNVKPGNSLFFFMIDVDLFKRINDTYGHTIGDQVFITVAELLKAACAGENCFLARLGGDEFGILLECAPEEEASALATKIHTGFEAFNQDSTLSMPINVSIGYTRCGDTGASVDGMIMQADKMMYVQKERRHAMKRFS